MLLPWWVSLGLAAIAFVILPAALPQPVRGLTPIITLFFVAMAVISALRSWLTARMLESQTGIDSLRELPWKRFEDLLAEAYRRHGYKVKETLGGGADGGIDLLLNRQGIVTIVQCKRWKGKPVPVQVVRELYGVMVGRGAAAAKVVATTDFTTDAVAFAKGKPIELINSEALLDLLRQVQASKGITPPALSEERDHLTPDCPLCGNAMVIRKAHRGEHAGEKFWGCSTFSKSKCRGTRPI